MTPKQLRQKIVPAIKRDGPVKFSRRSGVPRATLYSFMNGEQVRELNLLKLIKGAGYKLTLEEVDEKARKRA